MKKQSLHFLLLVSLLGCSKAGNKSDADAKGKATADPKSKEAAVIVLQEFHTAADGKDYAKAATYFIPNPDFKADKAEEACKRLLDRKEISAKGIEILAAKGTYGKASELQKSDRLKDVAKELGIEYENIYIFAEPERGASAILGWDGKQLKIIKLDDIGRLAEPAEARPKGDPGVDKKGPPPKEPFEKKDIEPKSTNDERKRD